MEPLVLIIVSIIDLPTIITLVVAWRAKRLWHVATGALAAAGVTEALNMFLSAAYSPFLLPYRIIGQLLVGLTAYWIVKRRRAKHKQSITRASKTCL